MEREEITVLQGDGGASPEGTQPEVLQREEPSTPAEPTRPALTEEDLAKLPQELRPDKDGNPPELTEQLLRKLRGKYFTVRHVLLTNCGHKIDMTNEPKNNCENCWFQWFNTHPQLVETADQFFRTHGKGPLVGMRGAKFFKMFVRYMSTIIHFMKEEEALKAAQEKANEFSGGQTNGVATENQSGEASASSAAVIEGGQVESNRRADGVLQ